ncbi:2-hydroxychromene-2-carboxylate isomerase/DsbA-like thioredoxin domain protein [Minicystis rosea]|nr:2-hydroxychromene-2-carboxylate isomerase/DsbA-like thioredoxin domain protein [Minicystis rosea]
MTVSMDRRTFLSLAAAPLVVGCGRVDTTAPAPSASSVATATAPIRVEVFHDLVCPWCRIGLHNLGVAIDGWSGSAVEVVLRPYLLEPETPPEGVDLRARLQRKYGTPSEQMFARVTAAGAKAGVRFDWEKVRIMPATAKGHALLGWAPREKQRALLDALHHAYFEEGANIGDELALASIAARVGLDGDAVRAAVSDAARIADVRSTAQTASAQGIDGVPHFRFGAQRLHGAQPPEALRSALAQSAG